MHGTWSSALYNPEALCHPRAFIRQLHSNQQAALHDGQHGGDSKLLKWQPRRQLRSSPIGGDSKLTKSACAQQEPALVAMKLLLANFKNRLTPNVYGTGACGELCRLRWSNLSDLQHLQRVHASSTMLRPSCLTQRTPAAATRKAKRVPYVARSSAWVSRCGCCPAFTCITWRALIGGCHKAVHALCVNMRSPAEPSA